MEEILMGTSINPVVQNILMYLTAGSITSLIIGFNAYILVKLYYKARNLIMNDGKVDNDKVNKGDRDAK